MLLERCVLVFFHENTGILAYGLWATAHFVYIVSASTGAQPASSCQSYADIDPPLQSAEMKKSISDFPGEPHFYFNGIKVLTVNLRNMLTLIWLLRMTTKCYVSWTLSRSTKVFVKIFMLHWIEPENEVRLSDSSMWVISGCCPFV